MSYYPLTHRPMTLEDLTNFYIGKRKDTILLPVICGDPEVTLWLKVKYLEALGGQEISTEVTETLYHPETGEVLRSKGDEIVEHFSRFRVAKKY